MQSIDDSDLEKLSDQLNEILKDAPEQRRKLHERLALLAKQEVDAHIGSSVSGDSGKVAGWQETHVGSGGGYAAVRATDSSTGGDSPGAVTNYLENGHRIRQPSGQAKRYRPEIKTPYVEGHHFYQKSLSALQSKTIAEAQQFADQLAERIERG